MAYVKLVKEIYRNESDMFKLSDYIYDLQKCKSDIYGGRNLIIEDYYNPIFIAEQFRMAQQGKGFVRRIYHLVISFDPDLDNANLMLANNVARCICNLYPNYQSFFAVHENTKALHIHIIFNNCAIYENMPRLSEVFNVVMIRGIVDEMIDRHLGIV